MYDLVNYFPHFNLNKNWCRIILHSIKHFIEIYNVVNHVNKMT